MKKFFWIAKMKIMRIFLYAGVFVKWIIIASITGVLGGFIGVAFNKSISYVTDLHQQYPALLFLMPVYTSVPPASNIE